MYGAEQQPGWLDRTPHTHLCAHNSLSATPTPFHYTRGRRPHTDPDTHTAPTPKPPPPARPNPRPRACLAQVFMRERLNGYYSVATFALANTIASAPFIFAIAIISSCIIYWLAMLNDDGDRFPYFFTNLFLALTVVESLMMMISAVVPHYLMGIAGGAGIMG